MDLTLNNLQWLICHQTKLWVQSLGAGLVEKKVRLQKWNNKGELIYPKARTAGWVQFSLTHR